MVYPARSIARGVERVAEIDFRLVGKPCWHHSRRCLTSDPETIIKCLRDARGSRRLYVTYEEQVRPDAHHRRWIFELGWT